VKFCRAIREVWPKSLQKVNLVEPSQSMQRAGRSLIQGNLLTNFFKSLGHFKFLFVLDFGG
jgi:hypothetical protein